MKASGDFPSGGNPTRVSSFGVPHSPLCHLGQAGKLGENRKDGSMVDPVCLERGECSERCWPPLAGLWRAIAPLMKPRCAEGDVPTAANLNLRGVAQR